MSLKENMEATGRIAKGAAIGGAGMRPRDSQGSELCGRIRDEVAKPWGSGWNRYRCEKPLGHKSKEHMCGKFRWTERKS